MEWLGWWTWWTPNWQCQTGGFLKNYQNWIPKGAPHFVPGDETPSYAAGFNPKVDLIGIYSHIYDSNCIPKDKASRKIPKKRKNVVPSKFQNGPGTCFTFHPLRERDFSEFDEYDLIIEEDKSPRRLDWVYIEELVEPSKEYLKLMNRNWNMANEMERQRMIATNSKEDEENNKSEKYQDDVKAKHGEISERYAEGDSSCVFETDDETGGCCNSSRDDL